MSLRSRLIHSVMKYELVSHRVQRVPKTESQGRGPDPQPQPLQFSQRLTRFRYSDKTRKTTPRIDTYRTGPRRSVR